MYSSELTSQASASDALKSQLRSEASELQTKLDDVKHQLQSSEKRAQELEEVKAKLVSDVMRRHFVSKVSSVS